MKLVLATRNDHKAQRVLAAAGAARGRRRCPTTVELPPETGDDVRRERARQGARGRGGARRPVIADDSGIESAALGGRPGVYSARFAGEDATDEENLAKLLREAPAGSALAYVCVIALVDPAAGTEQLSRAAAPARSPPQPRGDGGFGYDPAFLPDDAIPRRRPHDGRADAGREGRDQPPRPRGRAAGEHLGR